MIFKEDHVEQIKTYKNEWNSNKNLDKEKTKEKFIY